MLQKYLIFVILLNKMIPTSKYQQDKTMYLRKYMVYLYDIFISDDPAPYHHLQFLTF